MINLSPLVIMTYLCIMLQNDSGVDITVTVTCHSVIGLSHEITVGSFLYSGGLNLSLSQFQDI